MPLKLNSSGGGSVTLDVPATATATNLVVPAANGTVVVADNSGNVTYSGATTFSGNATFNAGLIPSSSFLRNRLINGGMEIAQRGTSGTSGYLLDRWLTINTSAQSQSSDAPTGFINSIEFTSSSATFPLIAQRIERLNSYDLAGRTVTVSFWARSLSGSSNLFAEIYRANTNDNFSSVTQEAFAILTESPSTSWTFYSVSFQLSASATAGIELRIVRGNASAASTRITGVQLEVGSVVTPFERRQYGQELSLCQRYARVLGGGMLGRWGGTGGGEIFTVIAPMRSNPSVSLLSTTATFFRVGIVAFSGTGIFIVGFSTTANGMAVTFGMNSTGANAGEFMALVSDILLANAEL